MPSEGSNSPGLKYATAHAFDDLQTAYINFFEHRANYPIEHKMKNGAGSFYIGADQVRLSDSAFSRLEKAFVRMMRGFARFQVVTSWMPIRFSNLNFTSVFAPSRPTSHI